jgi:hypothetical protein
MNQAARKARVRPKMIRAQMASAGLPGVSRVFGDN